jgi:sodium-dependent phosphate cotransporter
MRKQIIIFSLSGAIAQVIKNVLNPKFDSEIVQYFYGYVNLAVGGVMTFIVQSSSVFTSTLTPLVGIGLIEVEAAKYILSMTK